MVWPFTKRKASRHTQWDLSRPVLHWSDGTPWTIADTFAGTQILGSTGSGKTSGSLRTICRHLLRAGFGGIFLTAKVDDCATYTEYVRDAGRLDDLVVFSPDHLVRYNLVADEQQRSKGALGLAENLTSLVMTAAEVIDRGGGGGDNDKYFRLEAARLARNGLLILVLAGDPATIPDLLRLIITAPQSLEQVQSEAWQKGSFCYERLRLADQAAMSASQKADFDLALSYFLLEWPTLSSRTRSVVQSTLTSTLDLLSRGAARDMLSSPTSNISPAACYDGAIVIADFPTLVYKETGQLIQVLLKYAWQRCHAARDISKNDRPTFIVADESQLLLVQNDQHFQAIARSTRTAVVYACQSISGMLDAMGPHSEHKVHSLLANLATRICHQNCDTRTVQYMQELIGRSRQMNLNGSQQRGNDWLAPLFGDPGAGASSGFSEGWEHELQSGDFHALARGGPPRWMTEAIVYQGRPFPNGRTWIKAQFRQRP